MSRDGVKLSSASPSLCHIRACVSLFEINMIGRRGPKRLEIDRLYRKKAIEAMSGSGKNKENDVLLTERQIQ